MHFSYDDKGKEEHTNTVGIETNVDIKAGDQILVDYGPRFNHDDSDSVPQTVSFLSCLVAFRFCSIWE